MKPVAIGLEGFPLLKGKKTMAEKEIRPLSSPSVGAGIYGKCIALLVFNHLGKTGVGQTGRHRTFSFPWYLLGGGPGLHPGKRLSPLLGEGAFPIESGSQRRTGKLHPSAVQRLGGKQRPASPI